LVELVLYLDFRFKMKKLILGLAFILVSSGSLIFGVEGTKQRMPIPDERFYLRSQTWYFGGKAGVGELYDIPDKKHPKGDGKWDIVLNYLKCNGEMQGIPYGVYDKLTKTLYLDNNPIDGFVDRTIQNPTGRPVDQDAPDCP